MLARFLIILIFSFSCIGGVAAEESSAESRFSTAVAAAQQEFGAVVDSAQKIFGEASRAATVKFRTDDYQTYLQWLDAREIGDYDLKSSLEETAAGAEYAVTMQDAYDVLVQALESVEKG